MRPLRLAVKGFTAFRDGAEIDFTELDVFAISGPTGSGKSSLLDAMTYALFGRVERVGDRVGAEASTRVVETQYAEGDETSVRQARRAAKEAAAAGRALAEAESALEALAAQWRQAGDRIAALVELQAEAKEMVIACLGTA